MSRFCHGFDNSTMKNSGTTKAILFLRPAPSFWIWFASGFSVCFSTIFFVGSLFLVHSLQSIYSVCNAIKMMIMMMMMCINLFLSMGFFLLFIFPVPCYAFFAFFIFNAMRFENKRKLKATEIIKKNRESKTNAAKRTKHHLKIVYWQHKATKRWSKKRKWMDFCFFCVAI